jgi:hypothetical protein
MSLALNSAQQNLSSSIMKNLPHDIIRQIILLSTQEERSRKDTLDYWTRLWNDYWNFHSRSILTDRAIILSEVHNHMKQVTRLERDACHISALPLVGSPQADTGTGVMWRRVWWSRKSIYSHSSRYPLTQPAAIVDEWHSLLKDRRQKEAATHYDQTGEFLLAQHD